MYFRICYIKKYYLNIKKGSIGSIRLPNGFLVQKRLRTSAVAHTGSGRLGWGLEKLKPRISLALLGDLRRPWGLLPMQVWGKLTSPPRLSLVELDSE